VQFEKALPNRHMYHLDFKHITIISEFLTTRSQTILPKITQTTN